MTEPTVMHAAGPTTEAARRAEEYRAKEAAEHEALRHFSEWPAVHPGSITLGDLIVRAIGGCEEPYQDGDEHPECWDSLERVVIEQTALELKALNHALASDLTTDDRDAETFTQADACKMLKGIVHRMEASAELCHRLRAARWGHPSFGGGDNWAEQSKANGAEHVEGSES